MNALLLLALQFGSPTVLSLEDVCKATGYRKSTAYNELSAGIFPIPMGKQGKRLFADIRDVANYLERRRANTRDGRSAIWRKTGIAEWPTSDDDPPPRAGRTRPLSSLFLLLGMFDCAVMLSLDQICEATGYKKSTAYAARSAGAFPIPMRMCGKRLHADVRDVADYLDTTLSTVRRAPGLGKEAYALLSMRFGPELMNLDTVCAAIAWEKSTAYNALRVGTFPVVMRKFGRSWMADPRDVGFYLDEQRERRGRPQPPSHEPGTQAVEADAGCSRLQAHEARSAPDEITAVESAASEGTKPARAVRSRSGASPQDAIRAILKRKARKSRN